MSPDSFSSSSIRAIYWQDVVDRNCERVGCESLIRLTDVSDCNTEAVISQLSSEAISCITSELLFRISLNCLLSPLSPRGGEREPFKIFLNVEKQTLASFDVVDELIEASRSCKLAGYQLVVEATERPLIDGTPERMYIDGLIRLRQSGIPVVLDDYLITNREHIELELGLIGLVKLELGSLGIPLKPCASTFETLDGLQDQLLGFIRRYRVSLLAEKVETLWQSQVVSNLPFDYFQGYYFGRPHPADGESLMPVKTGGAPIYEVKVLGTLPADIYSNDQ